MKAHKREVNARKKEGMAGLRARRLCRNGGIGPDIESVVRRTDRPGGMDMFSAANLRRRSQSKRWNTQWVLGNTSLGSC